MLLRHNFILQPFFSPKKCIFASSNLYMMREKIIFFDSRAIIIKNTASGQKHKFEWTPTYYNKALDALKKIPIEETFSPITRESPEQFVNTPTPVEKNKSKILLKKRRKHQSVYLFIAKNPDCKASDICRKTKKSQSTVNRILKQLKDDGLIEHVGSKKTGGYQIVD